jgi:hypothetical protein
MRKIDCPCEECISLAICRHKSYLKLFQDCILLRIYEPFYNMIDNRDDFRIRLLAKTLNPLNWSDGAYPRFNWEKYNYE